MTNNDPIHNLSHQKTLNFLAQRPNYDDHLLRFIKWQNVVVFLLGVMPSSSAIVSPEAVGPPFGASRGSLFLNTGVDAVVVAVVAVAVSGVGDGIL